MNFREPLKQAVGHIVFCEDEALNLRTAPVLQFHSLLTSRALVPRSIMVWRQKGLLCGVTCSRDVTMIVI